jgi:hypothetical protein
MPRVPLDEASVDRALSGDFERIAVLTGQPTQWIVPRGSVS